jgi:hypothetical protein
MYSVYKKLDSANRGDDVEQMFFYLPMLTITLDNLCHGKLLPMLIVHPINDPMSKCLLYTIREQHGSDVEQMYFFDVSLC